jgi:putative transposase
MMVVTSNLTGRRYPMSLGVTVKNVTQAVRIIKQMDLRGWEWGVEYREAGREGIKRALEGAMRARIDRHLEELGWREQADRRNGTFSRHLLTEVGDIELQVPRTRNYSAVDVLRAYARRSAHIDRMILACFLLGLSTRKVAPALLPVLGEPVSATTVSRIAKTLDQAVAGFHRRKLADRYRVLLFDGVVLSRKTGMGALRRPVLVVLGICADGRKEIIDFRMADGESADAWEAFLRDLYDRGLTGSGLEMICADGGKGLHAALPLVYPHVPLQLCWAHKTRNITDKVRHKDREAVKRDIRKIYTARNTRDAMRAAGDFKATWQGAYPQAVACLHSDLPALLPFLRFSDDKWRRMTRTTNAIERRFREVRRRTRPMGVFSDQTSIERILYAVFTYENRNNLTGTLFTVTQNS